MSIKSAIDKLTGKSSKNIEDAISKMELGGGSGGLPVIWEVKGTVDELFGGKEFTIIDPPTGQTSPYLVAIDLNAPANVVQYLSTVSAGMVSASTGPYVSGTAVMNGNEVFLWNNSSNKYFHTGQVSGGTTMYLASLFIDLKIAYFDNKLLALGSRVYGTREQAEAATLDDFLMSVHGSGTTAADVKIVDFPVA